MKEIGGEKKIKNSEKEEEKPFIISVVGQCSNNKRVKIYECL